MSENPLVFISHRHADRQIAETMARFLRNRMAGKARVYLSSSPDFEGPRFGKTLNEELGKALAAAEAVILVFTSETQDWSYCMWECGVATDPTDEQPTAVVVLQCTPDKPGPYGDQLRVDVTDVSSLQNFVKALLTSTELFPHRQAPLTGFAPEGPEVRELAAELQEALAAVLPVDWRKDRRKPTCPYLRVRLPEDAAGQLRSLPPNDLSPTGLEIVATQAEIVGHSDAQALFGMLLRPGTTLGDVLSHWQEDHPDVDPRWFQALAEQIQAALAGKFRSVKWATYKSEIGRADVPFVSSWRAVETGVELDVYLVPISPRPILVSERMIPREHMYVKDAAFEPLSSINLRELAKEMNRSKVTRLPILHGGEPKAIVHLSTINQFLVASLDNDRTAELTLEDLLTECPDIAHSFVKVEPHATIEEAIEAMERNPRCQDVYVTREDKVVGWLPNVRLIPE